MSLGLLYQNTANAANVVSFAWPVDNKGNPTSTKKSGLQISASSMFGGNRGYRPMQITVSSAKPVTGDTQITVRFLAGISWNQNELIAVEQDFEMRQGASDAMVTMLVPQYLDLDFAKWEVWIDGRKDKELSGTTNAITSSVSNQSSGYTTLFFVSKDRHDHYDTFFQNQELDVFPQQSTNLPEDWKHYSTLDLVVVYPDDLKRWSATAPTRFAHLLRWVRAGGNLWIVETGAKYEKLEVVEKALLLSTPDQTSQEAQKPKTMTQRGWHPLTLTHGQTDSVDAIVSLEGLHKLSPLDAPSPNDALGNSLAGDSKGMFVARGYGMGTLVAFSDSAIKEGSTDMNATMAAINQTFLSRRLDWVDRHGNNPGAGNLEFGKFLIPDVGTAPVLEFQLLITLFILAIGPLNYWLLKRRQRLPLMLLTVPAAALVTTAILFAYGFVADGFGVRVRARSITILDQRLGEAVCWARLSYYAGIAPSKGLAMPDDTLVYPILPASSGNRHALQSREVQWGDGQKLTRGWLASRTPTQYLTISARPSARKISFQSSNETLTATNQLGTKILTLIVRDHEGNFYMGNDIDARQTGSLEPSESLAAILELRKLVTENDPEFPAGLEMAQLTNRSRGYGYFDQDSPNAESLLEDYLGSLISPLSDGLDHGVYIAITAEGIEVSLGLEDAIESASFHVVRGAWSYD